MKLFQRERAWRRAPCVKYSEPRLRVPWAVRRAAPPACARGPELRGGWRPLSGSRVQRAGPEAVDCFLRGVSMRLQSVSNPRFELGNRVFLKLFLRSRRGSDIHVVPGCAPGWPLPTSDSASLGLRGGNACFQLDALRCCLVCGCENPSSPRARLYHSFVGMLAVETSFWITRECSKTGFALNGGQLLRERARASPHVS